MFQTHLPMASYCFPDILSWIQNLPPISQWKSKSLSLFICSSSSSHQPPSLNLSVARVDARTDQSSSSPTISLSISVDISLIPVILWTSRPYRTDPRSLKLLGEEMVSSLFVNLVEDILRYNGNPGFARHSYGPRVPKPELDSNFKEIINLAFLTLVLLVCIYEAPMDLRSPCLNSLKNHLANCRSRNATKVLMKLLGVNLEELWMRSINLAITTWILELQASSGQTIKTPSPLFSYSLSTFGLWKVNLYCPMISMDTMDSSHGPPDERLLFSLNYHQLEGVIQFNYRVLKQQNCLDIVVNTDNIRCDVIRLVTESLMDDKGEGSGEKHFPSRIYVKLTPIIQSNILSISVGKSSENPAREFGYERGIEASFEPPNNMGITVSTGETTTMSLKPWKFEESVSGYSANFNWFLHDSMDGREVFSSKPSKFALLNPKAWFRDRYSSAYRPFTRQGGVIFAGDEYGDGVKWKVGKGALGHTMEFEIRGWIWLTYWPNKHRTLYNETRRLEFREVLNLNLA